MTEPPAPCAAANARAASAERGDTVVIDDDRYPCRLYFRETGTVLRGDSAARQPHPGEYVARDSRGRFLSNIAGDHSRLAVWNPDGSFDRTIGERGAGRSELPASQFAPVVHVDAADRIYVRSGGGLWSVFEPTLELVGRGVVPSGQYRHANAVFRGGAIITSSGARSDELEYFRRHDASGSPALGFGTIPLHVREGDSFRGIVAASDTSFWAGSDPADDDGYLLELWSTSGRRLAGFQRRVSWFPALAVATATPNGPREPRPTVNPVNVDSAGRLLVYALVTTDAWRSRSPGEAPPAVATDRNVHIEVVDWERGVVLASEVVSISTYGARSIPYEFFPRTSLGYRYDDTGESPVVRIVEYGLRERESRD